MRRIHISGRVLAGLAAFAPDAGEAIGPLLDRYPSKIGAGLRPDSAGFLYIDRVKFHEVFCADLSAVESRVLVE